MIESKDFNGEVCRLVNGAGWPVVEGDILLDPWGEAWKVTGGRAPHNTHTGGLVFVDPVNEGVSRNLYVTVLGLHWEPR